MTGRNREQYLQTMQEEYTETDDIRVSEDIIEKHRTTADSAISKDEYGLLIDGEWSDTAGGETITAVDATTGEDLARFQRGTAEDVDRAVASAREAFEGTWGQKSPRQRSDLL